jgi:ParB-like chromosome segregation protein Spo0J
MDLFEEEKNMALAIESCKPIFFDVGQLPIEQRIEAINQIRAMLHVISPFNSEPVDFVRWVKNTDVHANDYNPNSVAPPEMELLRHSILSDGYTQPIVTLLADVRHEVVDGFHRNRVGKECADVTARVHGYLPVVEIRGDRSDKSDRMAATIRHNRARGEHKVESMSEIIVELKRRFWSDEKISKELGMEPDEVLRLQQVTGLAFLFADREFSEAWEAESFTDEEIEESISPMGKMRGIQDEHVEGGSDSTEGKIREAVR